MPVSIDVGPRKFDADVFAARLASEGISARVVSDEAGGVEPALGYSGGFRVLVASDDADRARSMHDEVFLDEETETAMARSGVLRVVATAVLAFVVGCIVAGAAIGIVGAGHGSESPSLGICPDRPTGPVQAACRP